MAGIICILVLSVKSLKSVVNFNQTSIIPTLPRFHARANLTRLAVMRLLNDFSAAQLLDAKSEPSLAIWKTKQFSGPTWLDIAKWRDARREARQIFHQLFPFLKKT